MTEKLFYQDSRIRKFTARVESCRETEKNQYEVVLDRTAFFPEEGGQYADSGRLFQGEQEIPVFDVQEKNGILIHYTEKALQEGTEITGEIDYEERFSKMQQHTGEHIVSGIVHRRFGYNNVGFHLGNEEVTMDFDGMLTMEQIREIEREANEAVAANVEIQVLYPTKEELKDIAYRSKMEIEGQVRIVRIPGWDTCACCALHVTATGEIGIIKLTGAIKYKGGMRVSMLCGFRALEDYNRKEESVIAISRKLSAKPETIVEAVERLEKEIQAGKEKIIRLQEQYIKGILAGVKPEDTCVLLFEEELDPAAMRSFVNDAMEITTGICGVFIGNEEEGYRYVLGSKEQNINAIAKEMNQAFNGRGGGKPPMVQGSLKAAKENIEEFLKNR
ncbi:MAG: alanine--tRNA ligase-related protein [Firmicutes bacterium]|nr:alanine--tRNA ligase-related protein [Bacillota bacterium]